MSDDIKIRRTHTTTARKVSEEACPPCPPCSCSSGSSGGGSSGAETGGDVLGMLFMSGFIMFLFRFCSKVVGCR